MFDAPDGKRIFRADIEKSPLRADGVAAYQHAFHHAEGVGLQHAPVHERAGIALIGVAD